MYRRSMAPWRQRVSQSTGPPLTTRPASSTRSSTNPFGEIEQQIKATTGGTDPAALRDAAIASVRALVTGDQTKAAQARQQAT